MAIKYFCDICTKELEDGHRIILMGSAHTGINTLCPKCWNIAELKLIEVAKEHSELDKSPMS